jgi:hypothetical protein
VVSAGETKSNGSFLHTLRKQTKNKNKKIGGNIVVVVVVVPVYGEIGVTRSGYRDRWRRFDLGRRLGRTCRTPW